MRSVAFVCLLLGFACLTPAQMNMAGHAPELQNQVPPEELPVPQQMTGIGNAHLEITATREAQVWFDQGLNLLHDFWDYESARAFEQGIRADPQCAMCYWGLYKAESFYHSNAPGYAREALHKAQALEGHATERERLYIEATAAHGNAAELWRKLVDAYPHDIEAQLFFSQNAYGKSAEILESILKTDPNSSAANHYYIHALEATDHPERALHSAQILASLAPASGHMVHMPGHIYFRIGDYARAEQAFTQSMQVDERYMREQHVDPDNDWNYVHNLMYAVANLMEEGKLKAATALSEKLSGARGRLPSTLYIYSTRDSISRIDPKLPVALRRADWARVLELVQMAALPAERPNLAFLARQLRTFAAGMQAVERHDVAGAESLSREMDNELSRMSQPVMQGMGGQNVFSENPPKVEVKPDALLRPILSSLSILSLELRASLRAMQGKTDEAKNLFSAAAQQEQDLGYHEPPNYIRPVAEAEGAAMLLAHREADARSAYEKALRQRPHSGFALYGIARASEQAGNAASAAKEYRDFLAAWQNGDPALPEVIQARAYLTRP